MPSNAPPGAPGAPGAPGDRTTSATAAAAGTPGTPVPVEARIRAATLQCVGRWGVSKTTLDDIARAAGCSRATIYRTFPGGKDTVMLATFAAETASFFDELALAIDATATLEDLLVVALSTACRAIATDPVLGYLLEHEPEALLPFISFDGLDPLLDWARGFAVPHLERFVDAATAGMLGEWIARLVLSYGFEGDAAIDLDLADEDTARRFVRTYVLPGLAATSPTSSRPSTTIDLTATPAARPAVPQPGAP